MTKADEFRKLTDEELKNKLSELESELFKQRMKIKAASQKNVKLVRNIRKDIARLKTVMKEKQLRNSDGKKEEKQVPNQKA